MKPEDPICDDCAQKKGAVTISEDGLTTLCTIWIDKCCVCGRETNCCAVNDYQYKKKEAYED